MTKPLPEKSHPSALRSLRHLQDARGVLDCGAKPSPLDGAERKRALASLDRAMNELMHGGLIGEDCL